MDDLRERLEAVRLHLQQSDSAVFDSAKSPIILSHVATITAVLDHPERLLGEPVAWADPLDIKDAADEMVGCTNDRHVHLSKSGNKLRYTLPLYAPKEVKP